MEYKRIWQGIYPQNNVEAEIRFTDKSCFCVPDFLPKKEIVLMRIFIVSRGYPSEKYVTNGIFEFDQAKALEMEEKLRKATFDFNDFLDQLEQMEKMGSLSEIMEMIPGMSKQTKGMEIDDNATLHPKAIIQSMTPAERANPDLINMSRKQRIARGCGLDMSEINRFFKQFEQSKKMMKQFSGMMKGKKKRRFGMPFGF